jgi:hypothetical protein
MPKSAFDIVRKMGLAMPGVEEGTAYGSPALKIGGRMFACIATNKAAEPNTLVVCIDVATRNEMMAAEPDTYYLKEHYVNHPCVLVRLSRIHPDALRDLLTAGCRFVSSAMKAKKRRRA